MMALENLTKPIITQPNSLKYVFFIQAPHKENHQNEKCLFFLFKAGLVQKLIT